MTERLTDGELGTLLWKLLHRSPSMTRKQFVEDMAKELTWTTERIEHLLDVADNKEPLAEWENS